MRKMLRHTCTINRMSDLAGGRRQVQPVLSNVPSLFLPLDTDVSDNFDISLSQGYEVYFLPGTNVQVTDTLQDGKGNIYAVKGRQDYYELGKVSHVKVVAEWQKLIETGSTYGTASYGTATYV